MAFACGRRISGVSPFARLSWIPASGRKPVRSILIRPNSLRQDASRLRRFRGAITSWITFAVARRCASVMKPSWRRIATCAFRTSDRSARGAASEWMRRYIRAGRSPSGWIWCSTSGSKAIAGRARAAFGGKSSRSLPSARPIAPWRTAIWACSMARRFTTPMRRSVVSRNLYMTSISVPGTRFRTT